jgi:diacylglycerol O-acyltransferase / trehalose O-mycolyltransferase
VAEAYDPRMDALRRRCLLLGALLFVVACTPAPVDRPDGPTSPSPAATRSTDAVGRGPRLHDLTIASTALGFSASVRLLLPTAFDAEPQRRWPVLYLLHGCCDSYDSWTRSTDVEELTADSDVIVAMPDGGRAGFYSDWRDGPAWERFHVDELHQVLVDEYRASDVRAIGGLSMGGLGALTYAARHPGTFRAAASYSGIVHTRLTQRQSWGYVELLEAEGEDYLALWGHPERDAETWAQHNPYDLAEQLRVTALFLSVGSGAPGPLDPPGVSVDSIERSLALENEAFASRLAELGIPVQISFYGPGTHTWPYWERELHVSWPMFTRALGLQ